MEPEPRGCGLSCRSFRYSWFLELDIYSTVSFVSHSHDRQIHQLKSYEQLTHVAISPMKNLSNAESVWNGKANIVTLYQDLGFEGAVTRIGSPLCN